VGDVQRLCNRDLNVLGVLPTMYDSRTNLAKATLADVEERYGLAVIRPPIAKSVRFAEAPSAGRSVLSTARTSRGADAYRKVAERLMEMG
jgi:chromosome partitioning protein